MIVFVLRSAVRLQEVPESSAKWILALDFFEKGSTRIILELSRIERSKLLNLLENSTMRRARWLKNDDVYAYLVLFSILKVRYENGFKKGRVESTFKFCSVLNDRLLSSFSVFVMFYFLFMFCQRIRPFFRKYV